MFSIGFTQAPKESPYFRNTLAIFFDIFEISLHLGLFDSERCTSAAYIYWSARPTVCPYFTLSFREDGSVSKGRYGRSDRQRR